MDTLAITDPLFREAVEAIDRGNVTALKQLLHAHPQLVKERLADPREGYFKQPYLLWFVADNPIRTDKLPANIVEITGLLIAAVKEHAVDSLQQQLDYTLGLVETGSIPARCGVQIPLLDLLIKEGARIGHVHGALAHNNIEAAKYLVERGANLTLTAAVCLDRAEDIERLGPEATSSEKQTALTAAAFFGKTRMLSFLLSIGADPNAYPAQSSGFHSHATPLHQAVYSGSLDAVKLLVEAGAHPDLPDRVYNSTALEWAAYMQTEQGQPEEAIKRFAVIETWLREKFKKP